MCRAVCWAGGGGVNKQEEEEFGSTDALIILPLYRTDRRNENQTVSKLHLSTDCHLPIFFYFCTAVGVFFFVVLFCSKVN